MLACARPWGLRLPRLLVILPALAGAAYAAAHALTAYITEPLHALGAIRLPFKGWAKVDEGALIRWDLVGYEPWFLGSRSSWCSRPSITIAGRGDRSPRCGASSRARPGRRSR